MRHILVTGGARSGKSAFAEQLAVRLGTHGTYVATALALDAEMEERVALHREQREAAAPGFWTTVEEPLALAERLMTDAAAEDEPRPPLAADRVVLVDCLTLWLSNWVLAQEEAPELNALIHAKIEEMADAVRRHPGQLVLVTNEVGSGIVPAYKLGRVYRDLAGRMNQRLAAMCDRVFLVTAGIPVELKSQAFQLDSISRPWLH